MESYKELEKSPRRVLWLLVLAAGAAGAQTTDPGSTPVPEPPPGQTYRSDTPMLPGQVSPESVMPAAEPTMNPALASDASQMPAPSMLPDPRDAQPVVPPITREVIGDAYSLREGETALEVMPREGTGPALGDTLGQRVNRLQLEPIAIRLELGESYSLRDLAVLAYGRNNVLMEHVPLVLELEGPEGLMDLSTFHEDGHTIRAAGRGIGRLWVTSLVPPVRGEHYAAPVVIVVREPRRGLIGG
jgi:hypothetical protein